MTSKLPVPHVADEPTEEPHETPGLPNRPEFEPVTPVKKQPRILLLLVLLIVFGLVAGGGLWGYHYYLARDTKPASARAAAQVKVTDPYTGWKTYTSSFDSFSFRYPSNWTTTASTEQFGITVSDSLQMKSPSGLTVSWFSAIQGIGGACDPTIMPGTPVSAESAGPCPYWYVLDKQKIAGADLYYVAGVETLDGKAYSPWCGVQSSDGITKDEGNIGYMLFRGHHDVVIDGHDDGLNSAGLMCSGIPGNFGGLIQSAKGSKAQATAYLSTPEFQQAKLILLSLVDAQNQTTSWYHYVSPGNHYSVRLPDGWNLIQNGNEPWSELEAYYTGYNGQNTDPLAIKPGTKATVTYQSFGKDGNPLISFQWYDFANSTQDAQKTLDNINATPGLQKQASFQTDSGQTVDKYFMTVTTPPQNIMQPELGTYYEYVIKNTTGFVWVFNFYPPGAVDRHANVEEAIQTLQLNS